MKTLKRIVGIIAILILVVIIVGIIIINRISRKALPDYNQNVTLSGLTDEVMVYRDMHAVPHIYAKNENDLYLTVGYLMAQDRLWHMDLLRRVTQGAFRNFWRGWLIPTIYSVHCAYRINRKWYLENRREHSNALNAFSEGVNQFIEKSEKVAPEFTILGYKPEPWQPIHSINLIGYMAWDLRIMDSETLHKLKSVVDEEKFGVDS